MAEAGVGAVSAHHGAHAAEGEVSEVAVKIEARIAAEEAPALAERAGIGAVPVFKNEADLEAVAEVFRSFKTEAGTQILAGRHFRHMARI